MFEKCSCQHCGGHIEFDASHAGQVVACPHCGLETGLYVVKAPSAMPPQNVSVEIKRGMNPLGIASLILGILACAFCWIPFLGLLAIPLAAIGLLLALIGITSVAIRKKSSLAFPIGGAVVCAVAILVAIFVTGGVSTLIAKGKQTNQEQVSKSNEQAHSTAEDWSKSPIVKQGDIRVAITRVFFPTAFPPSIIGEYEYNESAPIQIELLIENLSTTKKVDFVRWSGRRFSLDGSLASLTDNNQNKYKLTQDGIANENAIYPQQSTNDNLEFEPPVKNIQWLHLELSAENFGGSGMLRFEFSIEKIRAAIEEVKEARAIPVSYETNTDYVKIKNQISTLNAQYETISKQSDALFDKVHKATDYNLNVRPEYNLAQVQGWQDEGFRLQDEAQKILKQLIPPLENKLSGIAENAMVIQREKVSAAQFRLAAAETNLDASVH